MLLLASAALVMPAIYELVVGSGLPAPGAERVHYDSTVEHLSLAVAIVLLFSYVAGLYFSLRTHRDLFNPPQRRGRVRGRPVDRAQVGDHARDRRRRRRADVGDPRRVDLGGLRVGGLSEFFVGVIIVAIVGNAAEHWVAVLVARKDKMDLAVNIAIGSSAQIALFAAPLLVLLSFFVGPHPMALVLNGFELGGILLAIIIANPRHPGGRVDVVRGACSSWRSMPSSA